MNLTDILVDPERIEIKIVPDDNPDADGEWLFVGWCKPKTLKWSGVIKEYQKYCPKGHHIVSIRRTKGN